MPIDRKEEQKRARELRIKQRLSIKAIAKELGVAKSSVSVWLRDIPLNDEEKRLRYVKAGKDSQENGINPPRVQKEPIQSIIKKLSENRNFNSNQKGKIAEAATMLRFAVLQMDIYKSVFDGEKLDFIIQAPDSSKLIKIQVKWTRRSCKNNQASMSLRCSNSRKSTRRYTNEEFDFIIGYDLESDTCYVYSQKEVEHINTCIVCSSEYAEAWQKIFDY